MKYIRVTSSADGETHFEDAEMPMSPFPYAPPAPPVDLSRMTRSTNIGFLEFPPGFESVAHCTPIRQFILVLSGEGELGVSNGDVRKLSPGTVLLLEDTSGKGHTTRISSKGPALAAFVQVPESSEAVR